jgi:hypothetical protein
MDSFNYYVLGTALLILILALTYMGILMMYYKKKTNTSFPPMVATCPDYWNYNPTSNTCTVPGVGSKNTGKYYKTTPNGFIGNKNYPVTNGSFDPTNPAWSIAGSNAVCNQKVWANANGIIWDGVTNNSNC